MLRLTVIFLFAVCINECYSVCNAPADLSARVGFSTVPASNPCIKYFGRTVVNGEAVSFDWSGIEIRAQFEGSYIAISMTGGANQYNVFVDNKQYPTLIISGNNPHVIASNLSDSVHTLKLTKRTEAFFGVDNLISLQLADGKWLQPYNGPEKRKIEIIGDSITCGYGDEGHLGCHFSADTENNFISYGPLIAQHFGAEYNLECWSGKGIVRNYGDPNITSVDPFPIYYGRTLATVPTDNWAFNWKPDAVMINLCTNDCSTNPIPPDNVFEKGYTDFIGRIRSKYGNNIPIFVVYGPLLDRNSVCYQYIKKIVAQNNLNYIELVGVLQYPNDYGCDYHPSVSGHQKMAAVSIPVIAKVMNWQ